MKLDVRHLGIPDQPLVGSLADDACGRFANLDPSNLRNLRNLARDQGVRRIDETLGRVIETIRLWPEFAAEAGLPDVHAAMLASEMPAIRW